MAAITICGSMVFHREMKEFKQKLEQMGFDVLTPPFIEFHSFRKKLGDKTYFSMKANFTKQHFDRISGSDAILVLNFDKNGKKNYIGGAVLCEMALAFYQNKPIFLMQPIPFGLNYAEEITALNPIILKDLNEIQNRLVKP